MSQKEVNELILKLIQIEGERIDSLYKMVKSLQVISDGLRWAIEQIAVIPNQLKKDIENEKIDLSCPHGLADSNNCKWCSQFPPKKPESAS